MSDKITKTTFEKAVRKKAEIAYRKNETELYNFINSWVKGNGYSEIFKPYSMLKIDDNPKELAIQAEESKIQLDVFNKLDELKFLLQEQDNER